MVRNVTEYLHNSNDRFSQNSALVDKQRTINYADYQAGADKIAYTLIDKGLFKKPIAVYMEKTVNMVISFLGVAQSGNYYTVIDNKMPVERINKILDTFKPEVIFCDEKSIEKASQFSIDTEILGFERVMESDLEPSGIQAVRNTESSIIDTDILYVLFTSGSTGMPKGVIINHRSVIDYIEWAGETFGFDEGTVFGNQAPFYFDNSVLDIYSAIRCGGCLNIIPQTCFSFPIRLLEYIRDNKINTVFWVPTVLSRVADLGILDKCDIDCLKNVIFAGEVMPTKQLNVWMRRLPNAVFANLYGPTEITVDCTYYIVNRKLEDDEPVPIGYPCRNSDILVFNEKNQLVEPGEKGELCVRGTSLSMGYYNDPERTKVVFVQNPLHNLYEEKIYRTGDIVHYNELGEIIYDGRADSQVKHTGHRIELGEIDTAVSSLEGIEFNATLHKVETDQLILFYTGSADENDIRKLLAKMLPEYMLPNICTKLERMPINANGKIDRKELRNYL